MNRNTVTIATHNITNNLCRQDSEGYTQFPQALHIQLNINVDQDHKDFKAVFCKNPQTLVGTCQLSAIVILVILN